MGDNADFVIRWITRMTRRHGRVVYEKGRHNWWDWGQALCREQYGKDWNDIVPDEPTDEDRRRAWDWESGDVPDWVDTERMILVSIDNGGERT